MLKKTGKVILKTLLAFIAVGFLAFVALKISYSDPIPKGKPGEQADALATSMLEALNYSAYKNTTRLDWTFRGKNSYEWYLQEHMVEVYWNDYHVTYNTRNTSQSKAYLNETPLDGEAKEEALAYAVSNFNNDSFWLVAPFKVFDEGTIRSIVEEEGKQKLLVQYTTGGTTPGDAYLWELDKDYKPVAFKMWVSILPFDGLEALWYDWKETNGGFWLAYKKSIFGFEVPVTNLKVNP